MQMHRQQGVMQPRQPPCGIPKNVIDNLGQMVLEKGTWYYNKSDAKGFYLMAWDFAADCSGEKCPVFKRCTYLNEWEKRDKCRMQQQYFLSILRAFIMLAGKDYEKVDDADVIKFGYSLLPLYGQLFRFKLFELGNNELLTLNARGEVRINPVYKEIREIIKTIHGVWRDICQSVKPDGGNPPVPGIGSDAFIDALYAVNEDDGKKGKTVAPDIPEDGSGVDFEGEERIPDGDGMPVDIEKYNTVVECKEINKTSGRKRKRHALDKVDWRYKERLRKERKAREPKKAREPRKPIKVLSPMQKIRQRNAEERTANMEMKKDG